MKNIILFDDDQRVKMLPLSFTRPVAEMRVGILTISEKWQKYLNANVSYITQDYLSTKFPINIEEDNYIINGRLLPNKKIIDQILSLQFNQALLQNNELIAAHVNKDQFNQLMVNENTNYIDGFELDSDCDWIDMIERPYDIFEFNALELNKDFQLLTKGRKSAKVDSHTTLINPENIFIEESANISCAILNATKGPIYIGSNTEIMEGTVIRGPFAMNDFSTLKMLSKIYGATTLGPYCKVGGEINNVVFQGYCSKAHDGYLGNAVIGHWCNLGADTNNSNLKNNYSEVKLWDYSSEIFEKTGLQFCGLIMGDHSKCGINTMFNTGTVVGISANIFGSGYPRNFIPSFSWGGKSGLSTYKLDKVNDVVEIVLNRRNKKMEEEDRRVLEHIFMSTSKYRSWEKKN